MPQPPFETDVLQIESGSGDTLTISRDSSDGSLSFVDAVATSGVLLKDLAGLRSVAAVYTVGQASLGVEYTSIQEALDAVPSSSSSANPVLILVAPGVYSESLTIEKDGVFILGIGATVTASSGSTVTIQESVSATPKLVVFRHLEIENTGIGGVCITATGGATSEVLSERLWVQDCSLVASGVGGFQIVADTVNHIEVEGGSFRGSDNGSATRVTNCASLHLRGVSDVVHVQADYDNGNPTPLVVSSAYTLRDLNVSGNLQSTLTGVGSLDVVSLGGFGSTPNLTLNGDRIAVVKGSSLGDVVVNGTSSLELTGCTYDTLSGAGAVDVDSITGSLVFAASASESVVFTSPRVDDQYHVHVETELTEAISVTSKTAAGFDLSFSGVQTTTVNYTVVRRQ